ncbi:hypothetical protein BpHYR1_002462 [Brachionus plicatilis]|uniref:Uncharacterized protein n=1 Tax=Brachionus plicatilis TaxID=10195 RepID=A0A3M7SB14_BRAPC|nr:hypothetical protein BpHYR1_002462 [Brachionus plicatilis]
MYSRTTGRNSGTSSGKELGPCRGTLRFTKSSSGSSSSPSHNPSLWSVSSVPTFSLKGKIEKLSAQIFKFLLKLGIHSMANYYSINNCFLNNSKNKNRNFFYEKLKVLIKLTLDNTILDSDSSTEATTTETYEIVPRENLQATLSCTSNQAQAQVENQNAQRNKRGKNKDYELQIECQSLKEAIDYINQLDSVKCTVKFTFNYLKTCNVSIKYLKEISY